MRSQMQFLQDAFKSTIQQILSNLTAVDPMFIISGVNAVIDAPDEGNVTVTVQEGVICFNGEPIPVPAQEVTHAPDQVAYFVVEEVGVDTTPVVVQGQSMNVKMHRYAKLTVGSNYPSASTHCKVDAPTMNAINKTLMGESINLQSLDILATAMSTVEMGTYYDATGLGVSGTPGEGRALCNGLNETPDLRGLTIVGAVNGVQAGTQELPNGVEKNWGIDEVFGEDKHKLDIKEMPRHRHSYQDYQVASGGSGFSGGTTSHATTANNNTGYQGGDPDDDNNTKPHNNIQPSRALVYVMIL